MGSGQEVPFHCPIFTWKWESGASKRMTTPDIRLLSPTSPRIVTGTKRNMPNRKAKRRTRGRFHLTAAEVSRLKAAALRDNQYGSRDALMISLAFRSCLLIGELVT